MTLSEAQDLANELDARGYETEVWENGWGSFDVHLKDGEISKTIQQILEEPCDLS